ncbi:hypothetical protein N7535_005692 [Penicillium sp. DV-2018c]|nr:hypothetical protein N7461_009266 [Penicillium sp. DV-2018c]KAJ5572032.1 hypothetical protein N7535_005692 [Penicillium sp. DV-2018c]
MYTHATAPSTQPSQRNRLFWSAFPVAQPGTAAMTISSAGVQNTSPQGFLPLFPKSTGEV